MATNGRALIAGVLVGGAVVLSLGSVGQPANRQADEVMARLDRIEKALYKPGSTLPTDPNKCIEEMLEDVLASTGRIEQQLGLMDAAKVEDLSRRIRAVHESLLDVKVAQLVDIDRRIAVLERQFGQLGPNVRLEDLARQIDDLERKVGTDVQHAADDNRRAIDDAQREMRRLDTRLTRVESKIR
jgi:hypothetical protein